MQKHEFDLALALVVEAIGRGKGVERIRAELVDFVGDAAGKMFDQEIGPAHVRKFDVYVQDWTGASS
jgi:hypothetical protein